MQAIIDTITRYWDAFINYFNNVFTSLKLFLFDLPILIFEKVWTAVKWLFNWASDSCSYCFTGANSLPGNMKSAFDMIAASQVGPAILYCLQRSGLVHCFQILTFGVIIWSVFKLIGFIKGIL
ncbi:MAG: hypothetical protein Q7U66_15240 [Methylobacter sp.]|nr:hypothetical protein [Methylobacter sp.]